MSNTALTWLRLGATGIITGLAAVYPYYPHWYWITGVIAAGTAIGIHAIPAVGQTTGKVNTMSEPNGRQLMGLDAPTLTETGPPAVAETGEVNPAEISAAWAEPVDLGQVAYEAYSAASGGKSLVTGETLPGWEELAPEIRAAWRAAGDAVRRY